jgi:hypothetical protein
VLRDATAHHIGGQDRDENKPVNGEWALIFKDKFGTSCKKSPILIINTCISKTPIYETIEKLKSVSKMSLFETK